MCDPEGCSTVWGAVWGWGGGPHPPPKGGGGQPPPPPFVDPNPAPFMSGPVQARKHTKLRRRTVTVDCFAALQHFQSSTECCLQFAQRPSLPLVTNHRHIYREAKGATDIYVEKRRVKKRSAHTRPGMHMQQCAAVLRSKVRTTSRMYSARPLNCLCSRILSIITTGLECNHRGKASHCLLRPCTEAGTQSATGQSEVGGGGYLSRQPPTFCDVMQAHDKRNIENNSAPKRQTPRRRFCTAHAQRFSSLSKGSQAISLQGTSKPLTVTVHRFVAEPRQIQPGRTTEHSCD